MTMAKLRCKNYGFDCDFVSEDTEISKVLQDFRKHTLEVHGIEYSKEALMQFILRQGG
jgi:predicted small metal-binding protein